MKCRGRGPDHVYCASLFSIDGPAGSLRRPDNGSTRPLPESRALAFRAPSGARRRIRPSTRVAGVTLHPKEIHMNSIAVGFGVATLVATGLLFVLQVIEDFRDV